MVSFSYRSHSPALRQCFSWQLLPQEPATRSRSMGVSRGKYLRTWVPPVPGSGGCVFDFFVSNSGNATVLGPFTGTAEFKPNLCDGSYTGFFHWIAANGDAISGPFFGQLIPTATQGVFDNNETAIVTGGTGRFTGATGMFTLGGQVNFITSSFVFPWTGTISSVGSNIRP